MHSDFQFGNRHFQLKAFLHHSSFLPPDPSWEATTRQRYPATVPLFSRKQPQNRPLHLSAGIISILAQKTNNSSQKNNTPSLTLEWTHTPTHHFFQGTQLVSNRSKYFLAAKSPRSSANIQKYAVEALFFI